MMMAMMTPTMAMIGTNSMKIPKSKTGFHFLRPVSKTHGNPAIPICLRFYTESVTQETKQLIIARTILDKRHVPVQQFRPLARLPAPARRRRHHAPLPETHALHRRG